MPALLRAIRTSPALRSFAATLGAALIRVADRTVRWRVEGAETRAALQSGKGRWLLAVPHGRALMAPAERRPGLNVLAMISANNDGDIIARIAARFGARAARGSSMDPHKALKDKGGRRAFGEADAALADGGDVLIVITPDGPRGPRLRPKAGIALLSIRSRAPVVPWAFSARPALVLGSWDAFMAPLPFARGAKVVGDPIHPPQGADAASIEGHRAAIEAALIAVARRADELVGRAPVEPGEPLR